VLALQRTKVRPLGKPCGTFSTRSQGASPFVLSAIDGGFNSQVPLSVKSGVDAPAGSFPSQAIVPTTTIVGTAAVAPTTTAVVDAAVAPVVPTTTVVGTAAIAPVVPTTTVVVTVAVALVVRTTTIVGTAAVTPAVLTTAAVGTSVVAPIVPTTAVVATAAVLGWSQSLSHALGTLIVASNFISVGTFATVSLVAVLTDVEDVLALAVALLWEDPIEVSHHSHLWLWAKHLLSRVPGWVSHVVGLCAS